jgi:hypothetical protein
LLGFQLAQVASRACGIAGTCCRQREGCTDPRVRPRVRGQPCFECEGGRILGERVDQEIDERPRRSDRSAALPKRGFVRFAGRAVVEFGERGSCGVEVLAGGPKRC